MGLRRVRASSLLLSLALLAAALVSGSSKAPKRVAQALDDEDDCFSEDGSKTNVPASPPAAFIGESPVLQADAANALIDLRHEDAALPSSPVVDVTGSFEEGLQNIRQPPGHDSSQDRSNCADGQQPDEISNFGLEQYLADKDVDHVCNIAVAQLERASIASRILQQRLASGGYLSAKSLEAQVEQLTSDKLSHEESLKKKDEAMILLRNESLSSARDLKVAEKRIKELEQANQELTAACAAREMSLKSHDEKAALSAQKILDLEASIARDRKLISEESQKIWSLYKDTLLPYGAGPAPFAPSQESSPTGFFEWLQSEIKAIPEVMDGVNEFGAALSVTALLTSLEQGGCNHFDLFRHRDYNYPSASAIQNPSDKVRRTRTAFVKIFWRLRGLVMAKEEASSRYLKMQEEERAKVARGQTSTFDATSSDAPTREV